MTELASNIPSASFAHDLELARSVAARELQIHDLGRMAYAPAYERQVQAVQRVLAARDSGTPIVGEMLLVEHDPPVITISRRPGARANLLASDEALARAGVTIAETDRGGDITYHGPGQLVAYPILDLNTLGLNLHAYMRLLEQVVIDVCAGLGLAAHRDACATGVWVGGRGSTNVDTSGAVTSGGCAEPGSAGSKICALGVRVRRWVSMHGLALNVSTNLDHFGLIVPCGLVGRGVTSLQRELGTKVPPMPMVKRLLSDGLRAATCGGLHGPQTPALAPPAAGLRPPPTPVGGGGIETSKTSR